MRAKFNQSHIAETALNESLRTIAVSPDLGWAPGSIAHNKIASREENDDQETVRTSHEFVPVAPHAPAWRRGPHWRNDAVRRLDPAGTGRRCRSRSEPGQQVRRATPYSSACRCRAPAPMPYRAKTSSRATSSRSSTSMKATNWSKDLAQVQEGRARQAVEARRRRFRRQAERSRAGATALHFREQGGDDHRRHVERGRGRAQQAGAARKGACSSAASPVRTTPPARIACATASARTSSVRPRRRQSLRFLSRNSARTRRWPT